MGFAFDPNYRQNGMFYTIHLENPALTGDARPKTGVLRVSTPRGSRPRSPLAGVTGTGGACGMPRDGRADKGDRATVAKRR